MAASDYIKAYIQDSRRNAEEGIRPQWLRDFFAEFAGELEDRCSRSSAGGRYVVSGAFDKGFWRLVPSGIEKGNQRINEYLDGAGRNSTGGSKAVDFVLKGAGGQLYFIEFKTNLTFNDLAAAMVEMALVKMHLTGKTHSERRNGNKVRTASIHLFPKNTSVEELMDINSVFGSPLDKIWVLCGSGDKPQFCIKELKALRRDIKDFMSS